MKKKASSERGGGGGAGVHPLHPFPRSTPEFHTVAIMFKSLTTSATFTL